MNIHEEVEWERWRGVVDEKLANLLKDFEASRTEQGERDVSIDRRLRFLERSYWFGAGALAALELALKFLVK